MSKAKVTATPVLREKTRIMSASEIERTLIRLAHQIIEKNNGGQNLGLVGIKRHGVPLAQRLGHLIGAIEKVTADPALHTPDLGGKATTKQVTDSVCGALWRAND